MNALDKTNIVRKALECCRYGEEYRLVCNECPYDNNGCKPALYGDALAVIDGFKAELKKRTTKSSAAKPAFITLTRWIDSRTIAVNVDAIRYIEDASTHTESTIYFKEAREPRDETILVKETIIDILEKISEGKSE